MDVAAISTENTFDALLIGGKQGAVIVPSQPKALVEDELQITSLYSVQRHWSRINFDELEYS